MVDGFDRRFERLVDRHEPCLQEATALGNRRQRDRRLLQRPTGRLPPCGHGAATRSRRLPGPPVAPPRGPRGRRGVTAGPPAVHPWMLPPRRARRAWCSIGLLPQCPPCECAPPAAALLRRPPRRASTASRRLRASNSARPESAAMRSVVVTKLEARAMRVAARSTVWRASANAAAPPASEDPVQMPCRVIRSPSGVTTRRSG